MVNEAKSTAEMKEHSAISQEAGKDLALFVTPGRSDSNNITVSEHKVVKAMFKRPMLVSNITKGQVEVTSWENVASYTCMTAKDIAVIYQGRTFQITIVKFDKVDVHPKKASKSFQSHKWDIHAGHYKQTLHRLKQIR